MSEDPCEKCGASDWRVQTKNGVERTQPRAQNHRAEGRI